mmetsp:Transcript_16051/g.22572  ORF Transcript_16051/g.22572 Transcript_16051/m.22572 type:complete len:142 (-) Transcript_16051:158-583(-)|eukprot:CAMPEP_0175104336 /NCGR_PEP_ID=MMETSP0086_2-20121207/9667_1 /TAXON_ID=136419 /ORGANISM="Unknown Unknown, Strain D1" /LENGTH=141 /DNA_ID=CAMNT_0016379709 /DNA_START=28 /DNA_END=453 /DNA_ORIENTATION=+
MVNWNAGPRLHKAFKLLFSDPNGRSRVEQAALDNIRALRKKGDWVGAHKAAREFTGTEVRWLGRHEPKGMTVKYNKYVEGLAHYRDHMNERFTFKGNVAKSIVYLGLIPAGLWGLGSWQQKCEDQHKGYRRRSGYALNFSD